MAREGNGKGFIDLGVVEARKGVEEVLVMFVRDCEFAKNKNKKSIFPLLNLTFFLSIFDGCILGGGEGGTGGEKSLKGLFLDILHYFKIPYVQVCSQEGWLDIVPQARKAFSNLVDPTEISVEFVA